MVCAIRSALARAASRRGSSTRIFLFLTQGSSSSASGTRVVLPAPGGATTTAALLPASVHANWSSTASIGRGVSKLRGKGGSCCLVASMIVPLSPCGRGWIADAERRRAGVRGLFLSTDRNPSPVSNSLRSFSPPSPTRERGRRRSLPPIGWPTHARIGEAERGHFVGAIDVAGIDDHRLRQFALQALQVERAILHPLRHHYHRIRTAH